MKWLKPYSIILLITSLSLLVTSFFVIDFLPSWCKFYIGNGLLDSKVNQLYLFSLNFTHELRIYSILLFFTASILYLIRTIEQYFSVLIFFILFHFIFIAEIGELVIFRRFYQMFIMIPLLWIFFNYFKFRKERYEKKITHGFLYITLLSIVLPGLYLPPFFTGIPGWKVEINTNKPFSIDGVFLIRNDGAEIRYSRAIVSPINFVTRLNKFILLQHPTKVHDLLKFYKEVYIKRYDILKQGYMPNEKKLGKLAYPIHNPYGDFNYSKFPPNSIREIRFSKKYYHWDKKFIKEEILACEVW